MLYIPDFFEGRFPDPAAFCGRGSSLVKGAGKKMLHVPGQVCTRDQQAGPGACPAAARDRSGIAGDRLCQDVP